MAELKAELRRETQLVREEAAVTQRQVDTFSTETGAMEIKMAALEDFRADTGAQLLELRLRMEEQEDLLLR